MQFKKKKKKVREKKPQFITKTPTLSVNSTVCSHGMLCGGIHTKNLDATGSDTYCELLYSTDFSLAFTKDIQNYCL